MSPTLLSALLAATFCAEPADVAAAYRDAASSLAQDRVKLLGELRKARLPDRPPILTRARTRLLEAFDRDLIPAWFGTPWEFYGISEKPGSGTIACGYLVSTLLRDAGFRVERVRMAQQASEHIVQTMTPEAEILRLREVTREQVVEAARAKGDGLYIVGFDFHVGLLRIDGQTARFCHSSYLGKKVVVCEPPEQSGAFVSSYYVLGDAMPQARIQDWLWQHAIPTHTGN
jgi:hypothetical protein